MVISIISRFICAWFAFLLPCFSTFKALSRRPLSEQDLERWSMYWTVLGVFLAFEYVAEWLVSWLPFYWELKTLFMLFLALPQTEGSTVIYRSTLQPFLSRNEADLDAGIMTVQRNAFSLLQTQFTKAWAMILELSKNMPTSGTPASPGTTATGTQPAASLVTLPWETAMGLWEQYGPSLMSALPVLSRPQPTPEVAQTSATSSSTSTGTTPSVQYRAPFPSHSPGDSSASIPFPEAQHF